MITYVYFLISSGIFLLFFILLTLMGYFIQRIIFSKFRMQKINLNIILESFGLGTVIFIIISYILNVFFRIFNFYVIYLPIIIFDSLNIIYLYYKKRIELNFNIKDKIQFLKQNLLKKEIKISFLIIIIYIILLIATFGVLEIHLSYNLKDPFIWASNIMYLRTYGELYQEFITVHTAGFVFFCAGALLITEDFYIMYFFLKYIPIFLILIIILACYNIFMAIFTHLLEKITALIIILCFNYFFYRDLICLPSILAIMLAIIFLQTLLIEENFRILIIRGFLIGGIFLSHILYGPLFLLFLISFELLNIFFNFSKRGKRKDILTFKFLLKKYTIVIFFAFLSIIPYILYVIINHYNFFNYYLPYINYEEEKFAFLVNLRNIFNFYNFFIISLMKSSLTENNLPYFIFRFGLDIIMRKTLNWGIIFLIFGLFYKGYSEDIKIIFIIDFCRFTFLVALFVYLINPFLLITENVYLLIAADFITQYGVRIFELFSPFWAILAVLGVRSIIIYIIKQKHKIDSKFSVLNKEIKEFSLNLKRDFKKIYFMILVILGSSLSINHIFVEYNYLYMNYYQDDDLTESVLFIGDYIQKNNIKEINILLPEQSETNVIFQLIYFKEVNRNYIKYGNTNYSEFYEIIEENKIDYVLFDKLAVSENYMENVSKTFKILYENDGYMFLKI